MCIMQVSRIAIQKLGKHTRQSPLTPVLQCDVLHDLVPFVQFKKRENTHGRVLLLVKL